MLGDAVEIAKVESGRDFVVYLATSGQLLQCGEIPRRVSYEKFQRRHGQTRSKAHAVGTTVKRMSVRERELYRGHTCDSLCCPAELFITEKVRVTQVACGVTHCVALGAVNGGNRALFSWGLGEYGQLGLEDCQLASKMTPVAAPSKLHQLLQHSDETHPAVVRCGPFSTYLLSRGSSVLWHWGLLPSPGPDSRFVRQGVPVEFPLTDMNTRLVDIAAGMGHMVLLADDGCVFTWGYGSFGQLGLGPSVVSNVENQPTQVDFFRQEPSYRITKISCGWNHCAALSRNGDVYAWGSNLYGECGAKSKFCDYFHPVLVAIPRPEANPPHRHEEIHCRGNSSSLLFRHTSGKYSEINQTFLWGVTAPGVGLLLPTEMLSSQTRLADCNLGLENSVWLLNAHSVNSGHPAWIVKEIVANDESFQELENGFTCLKVHVGATICIQVQPINKHALIAIAAFRKNDDTGANSLFELSTTQRDSAPSSDQNNYTGAIISSTSIARMPQGIELLTVEIIVIAQVHGRFVFALTSSIGEVVGNEFVVDVTFDNERETLMLETHGNQASICVLGVRVEGTEAENEEPVDAKWYKLLSKRIRVYTNDTVIVLIESTTTDSDPAIQVEYRDNHWQYELTHLDVVGSDRSRGKKLGVTQLRFPLPGQYFVYDTRRHEDEVERRTPLLVINCCLASQQRHQVLVEKHELIWSMYQFALANTPQSARFSCFLASVLQNPSLRDSVVCSPWITTHDEVSCESSFDFDREYHAQYELLRHPEHPFILWDSYLISSPTFSSFRLFPEHDKRSLSLSSILPEWATVLSSKVAFRIETWLEKPNAGQHQGIGDPPMDYVEARIQAATIGLSVQQIPFDFLGSVSHLHQSAVRNALVPVNPNIVNAHDSIISWRRLNGDLFYSVQANELLIRRYGHESHEFPETAQNGRITRLRSQLSDFLWQKAEGKKIEELFILFTSPTKPGPKVHSGIRNVIHLRELIFHSTALGFDEVVAVPKQEWFALFRGIQVQSPRDSNGITFSTFRTFLIDPFHQFFWKQYVYQIREQANSDRGMVIQTLTDSFKAVTKGIHRNNNDLECSGDDDTLIPWPDFVESLRRFHFVLGLSLPPPSDCCRLLYRFDTDGVGRISSQNYWEALLNSLDEIDSATEQYDFTKARGAQTKLKKILKVAIANGHRRPNLESFTSSEAVQKLFAARAKSCPKEASRSSKSHGNNTDAILRASANTHLARIRNLPISHLLREGIYFRPPRETLYRHEVEVDSTQAQAMGAEDSF
ncbi:hypothetical protein V7S43_013660 [Phytophthora oleae]|uniref:Calmodulin n=1 Tax=Phytophthora oleae TaxID=2107226 RepID=A0ABD3F615_9STRA